MLALTASLLAMPAPVGPVAAEDSTAVAGVARASAVTLVSGDEHNCALLDTGQVKCWGSDNSGQLGAGLRQEKGYSLAQMGSALPFVLLPSGRTATSLAAGEQSSCALLDNGNVTCWGQNNNGQLGIGTGGDERDRPPSSPINLGAGRRAIAITKSVDHGCAILDTGALKCWGYNADGQLGYGDKADRYAPPANTVSLGAGRSARAVSAGHYHTCAILDTGQVKCWGRNGSGQLGYGDTSERLSPPAAGVNLGAGRTAVAISSGEEHTCAILDTGQVKCWGYNGDGQLGYGDTDPRLSPPATPINLGAGRTARSIAAGWGHTCAVLDNTTVKCWGSNSEGQLGYGDTNPRLSPPASAVNPQRASGVRAVTVGSAHTCVVLDDATGTGHVRCWGYHSYGQLGLGDVSNVTSPASAYVDLGRTRTVKAVVAGQGHACAILGDGGLACWGRNDVGQLGRGTSGTFIPLPGDPIDLGPGRTAHAVAVGANHTCAILDTRQVKCWGSGGAQLGYGVGTTTTRSPPAATVNLGAGRTAKQIAAGSLYTCAVLDNDTLKCWGNGNSGRLGYGNTNTLHAPPASVVNVGAGRTVRSVAVKAEHTCAVLDNDTLKCWGNGNSGRLGYGNTNTLHAPLASVVNVGAGRTVREVAVGSSFTCARLDNHTVKCWGLNTVGQLGSGDNNLATSPPAVPVSAFGVPLQFRQVAAGDGYACGILLDDTVRCWGLNTAGQLGRGNVGNQNTANVETLLGEGMRPLTLSLGGSFGCALLSIDQAKCWGNGENGQLGNGDTDNRGDTPVSMWENLPVVAVGGRQLRVDPRPWVFESLSPARLLDTRASGATSDGQFQRSGLRPAGSTLELQVTGRAGVPADAVAVVLNVTVTGGTAPGFVTAFPCGSTRPNASNLNYVAGQTVPNLVIARIGTGGRVCLYAESATQLIADVTGYQPFHSAFVPLVPARLLDTRGSGATVDGQFQRQGRRPAGDVIALQVAGRGGIVATATAAVLNVTVTGATAPGFLTVYPCGTTRPNASNLNYRAGQTVPNLVIARIGTNGRVCIYNESATNVIADVAGGHPVTDPLVALSPARLLDTRSSGRTVDQQFQQGGIRPSGSTLELQVRGRGGVPNNATTAVLNLTASGATGAGFVTAYPCGTTRPNASNLNYRAGQTVPNLVVARIGSGGRVCLYTETATHLIADVTATY